MKNKKEERTRERAAVPRLLSLRAIAEETTIPRPTWYSIVARGEIRAVRVGRSVRIDERDLLAFLAARAEPASR
jgi:excisionase family DNA binding protein